MRSSDVLPHPLGPSSSQRCPCRTSRSTPSRMVVRPRTKRIWLSRNAVARTPSCGCASPASRRQAWPFVTKPRRVRHDRHPTETHRLHSPTVTWRRARFVIAVFSVGLLAPSGRIRPGDHGDGAERRRRRRSGRRRDPGGPRSRQRRRRGMDAGRPRSRSDRRRGRRAAGGVRRPGRQISTTCAATPSRWRSTATWRPAPER